MSALAIAFGAIVGISLGLTGGGGSIIAVPLLVYGLAMAPRQAVSVSLAAVGTTAFVGAVQRLWHREIEVRTGLMFAAAGMAGAPVGVFVGHRMPEALLLMSFAVLMVWVAAMMWRNASRRREDPAAVGAMSAERRAEEAGPACRHDRAGWLTLTSRCAAVMAAAGVTTGIFSGLFGVGGGFVVVPALVLFSEMGIHRAVSTSLLVIALVSAAGVASHALAGEPLAAGVTGSFVVGGIAGLGVGSMSARRLSPARLQQVFAVAIVAVAMFVILENLP